MQSRSNLITQPNSSQLAGYACDASCLAAVLQMLQEPSHYIPRAIIGLRLLTEVLLTGAAGEHDQVIKKIFAAAQSGHTRFADDALRAFANANHPSFHSMQSTAQEIIGRADLRAARLLSREMHGRQHRQVHLRQPTRGRGHYQSSAAQRSTPVA